MFYRIVDADTHINEPFDLWQKRVPRQLADRAPRVVDTPWGGKQFVFDGGRQVSINGLSNAAGESPTKYRLLVTDGYDSMRSGAHDPKSRIADMDIDMVDAHVLHTTYAIFAPFAKRGDPELDIACNRAYNDWMSEFCSYEPHRLWGLAFIPKTGTDDAIAEARRCKELPGIRGMLLQNWPHGGDEPDPEQDDRFWSAMEDLDFPAIVHVQISPGGSSEAEIAGEATDSGGDAPQTDMARYFNLGFINVGRMGGGAIQTLSHMIFGGVLERHPRLRVGLTETGIGWIPFFLEQSDDNFLRHRFWTKTSLRLLPSDYFHRQCFCTFQVDTYGIRNRDLAGVHNIMWSSDYPHTGADWPMSQANIANHMRGVPIEEQRLILAENALRLFGLRQSQPEPHYQLAASDAPA
jgi:predicted TIM-barrel fold metal-dependent hydrolase